MGMKASEILSETGPIAEALPGFLPRIQQQEMADAIAETIANDGTLISEAGTGTGKTFAYLVPALESGKKVIVSTGTKHLQDQLFHRDLPVVRDALKKPVKIALLKGRANYVCLYRLEQAGTEGVYLTVDQHKEIKAIREWEARTHSGDIAEVDGVSEESTIWPQVTSTVDNCLGQECPAYEDCYVYRARKMANESDVLVVNHHLFMADLSLREGGFGEVLPGAEVVIFDEAHQLHDIASQFFGTTLSSRQCIDLARDVIAAFHKEASDMSELEKHAEAFEKATRDFRLALGEAGQKAPWHEIADSPKVSDALVDLQQSIIDVHDTLKEAAKRGKALENCLSRLSGLLEDLDPFLKPSNNLLNQKDKNDQSDTQSVSEAVDKTDQSKVKTENVAQEGVIKWFETYQRSFALHMTPLDIARAFSGHRARFQCSWVFTSATLAVGSKFQHFAARLGLGLEAPGSNTKAHQWDSPFDYRRQAFLYVPELDVQPNQPTYTEQVIQSALPVLEASEGRAFFLFTSHRALQEAAERLKELGDFTLLVQGKATKSELIQQFLSAKRAVLLGTSSFWEGVDVRGDALSCVIIDKLPFASMGEPVMQARLDALREQGRNPFMEYQVPEAVIALKQGAGRLIRDVTDRGVLMICDPRLIEKPYGRLFLNSLPNMLKTRKSEKVAAFFDYIANNPIVKKST